MKKKEIITKSVVTIKEKNYEQVLKPALFKNIEALKILLKVEGTDVLLKCITGKFTGRSEYLWVLQFAGSRQQDILVRNMLEEVHTLNRKCLGEFIVVPPSEQEAVWNKAIKAYALQEHELMLDVSPDYKKSQECLGTATYVTRSDSSNEGDVVGLVEFEDTV